MTSPIGGDNAFFMDLYSRYLKDPQSVPVDWRCHFESLDGGPARVAGTPLMGALLSAAYREHGYKEARLDPLGLSPRHAAPELAAVRAQVEAQVEAQRGTHRLDVAIAGVPHSLPGDEACRTLAALYCGSAAVEASHVVDAQDRAWLYEAFEREMLAQPDETRLADALEAILLADAFETFIKTKWPTKKRFGIEGAESATVILREVLRAAASQGCGEAVVGGMHRGRLAALATVFGKSLPALVAEIKGKDTTGGDAAFTGDVPYHNGLIAVVDSGAGPIELRLLPHPSHLIVVAPVAMGAARARRELRARTGDGKAVLPLLMHTDAAFAGQGLVSELLQLGGLEGYSLAGTIHLVVNNQIGFTTLPEEGRSTPFPTDIGKAYGVPILHVNGDDPIAAAAVARIAVAWRNRTGRDAIIDLVCYRRNGHNELDEPRFTQPRLWSAIDGHPTLRTRFTAHVRERSDSACDRAERRRDLFVKALGEAFETHDHVGSNSGATETDIFPEARPAAGGAADPATGVDADALVALTHTITAIPADFEPDPKVKSFARARLDSVDKDTGFTMATGEALAFATLLAEGTSVRLSGQDSVRGTFTQRHLAVHDRSSGRSVLSLAAAAQRGARFDALNSPLTEYGVLGFEYGMSLADADRLVVWEAQFGDFLNGAQVAVDQYITTAEAKWRLQSSLVLALPHGLEGQGPDHSSARIERILQGCAGGNIVVAVPSTPASLFHLLRRQQRGRQRKPLFLIAPKSLLRDKRCQSRLADIGPGTRFQPVLVTEPPDPCRRVVLCSGKLFYALDERRRQETRTDVALVRLEQLYPFPADALLAVLARHGDAELVWCQEEPRNQGAFAFVRDQLLEAAPGTPLRYVGRPAMAAAAGGSIDRHELEQAGIVTAAFDAVRSDAAVAAE
ncbi:2-oxoglutarate dehydrogenase E1 component [Azospirillum doebereinerae]